MAMKMSVHHESAGRICCQMKRPPIIFFCVLCVLSLLTISDTQAIQLHLEPSGVLYVCTGSPFEVTCHVDLFSVMGLSNLDWNITTPNYYNTRRVFDTVNNSMLRPLKLNMTTLNFSLRTFPQQLLSTVFTSNTTADLNGTVLSCYWELLFNSSVNGTDNVQIVMVESDTDNVNITPRVNISQKIETSSITLFLEWHAMNGVSYIVNVHPITFANYTGKDTAQLTLSYNITYNASVVASLCGRNSTMFTVQKYVRCQQPGSPDQNVSIQVLYHRNIPIEGTTITLTCPFDLVLTGPKSSTCNENGIWDPDFKETRCKVDCGTPVVASNIGLTYTSTLEDSLLTFQCNDGLLPDGVFTATCYQNKSWIPNPSNHTCVNSSAESHILPIIGGSLGSSLGLILICCAIVVAIVTVIKSQRNRGTLQREIPSLLKILNCCDHQPENLKSNNELQRDNDQMFDLKGNEAYGSIHHHIQTEVNAAYVQVNL